MKKKAIFKNGIKAVAFLLIFALLFQLTTELLRSKWTEDNQDRYVLQNFYDLDEDSLDVLFLGSSQIIYGVNPVELYDHAGISAYCLGGASASLMSNYYWLIEAEKTQNPSVVMLEVSSLLEKVKEYQERKRVDEMRLSLNRLRFIRSLTGLDSVSESTLSYLIPIVKYHSRWMSLDAEDFGSGMNSDLAYRGYNIADQCKKDLDYDKMIIDNDDPEEDVRELYDYQLEYFVKIVEYCRENDIELVLFKTTKYSWKGSDSAQVQELADQYGLTYLDYDLQINRDTYDAEYTDASLLTTTDPVEWLTLLKQHSTCDIFLATCGDVDGQVSDELATLLADLGLETDLNSLSSGECFVALLTNDGTSIEEVTAAESAQISGTLDNGAAYSIASKNKNGTMTAELSINSNDTSLNGAGLNIRVYSETRGLALETVCIDLETGEMTCKTRSG